mgnify:CR=1 FL=1
MIESVGGHVPLHAWLGMLPNHGARRVANHLPQLVVDDERALAIVHCTVWCVCVGV